MKFIFTLFLFSQYFPLVHISIEDYVSFNWNIGWEMNICIAIVDGLQVRCWIRLFEENLTHLVKRTVGPYIFKAKPCAHMNPVSSLVNCDSIHSWKKILPPVRIELTAPGLRDQCSTTELKRRHCLGGKFEISSNMHFQLPTNFPVFPRS